MEFVLVAVMIESFKDGLYAFKFVNKTVVRIAMNHNYAIPRKSPANDFNKTTVGMRHSCQRFKTHNKLYSYDFHVHLFWFIDTISIFDFVFFSDRFKQDDTKQESDDGKI